MKCESCAYRKICERWKSEFTIMRVNSKNGACTSFKNGATVVEVPCEFEIYNREIQVLISYARNNMRINKTANDLRMSTNTVHKILKNSKEKYGLDPKNLFDLCRILSKLGNELKER